MQVFYAPNCQLGFFPLQEDESKHVLRVLRMKKGDPVFVIDGSGRLFEGIIFEPHPKHCILQLNKVTENFEQRNYRLHMAVSPLKSVDRFEWFIEKAIEIGVDEITPLNCSRTEKKNVNTDRLNRIVESAMKQSLKAYHPKMNEMQPYNKFVVSQQSDCQKGIAFCGEGEKEFIGRALEKGRETVILIGPEGDFTDDEVALAKANGFKGLSLGESRLRTETAGVVACHAISFINA
ncbi:MAG TPA: 16S rRNA (uracil(1498)-N(3))-methyltransferase [Bacteroidales bacterium]|nr:16S rRNA (uracil(1498)-N(3))-methyltransferase [Bacteroidales bacterium]